MVKNKARVGQQQGPDLVKHRGVLVWVAFILSEEEHQMRKARTPAFSGSFWLLCGE